MTQDNSNTCTKDDVEGAQVQQGRQTNAGTTSNIQMFARHFHGLSGGHPALQARLGWVGE
jgi:hypothetical protein